MEVDDKKQTTAYYNDKLPDANLKGDGIGDKYSNMVNNFGKIKDESAVENIERGGEEQKESYQSQYTDAEVAALDRQSDEARSRWSGYAGCRSRSMSSSRKTITSVAATTVTRMTNSAPWRIFRIN